MVVLVGGNHRKQVNNWRSHVLLRNKLDLDILGYINGSLRTTPMNDVNTTQSSAALSKVG